MSTFEELKSVLELLNNTGGIEQSAVASRDGLLIYSTIPNKPAETFVAMAATMVGAAEAAASELGKGIPERVIMYLKHGTIIGTGAGDKAFLLIVTKNNGNIDTIIEEIAKASEKIKQVLSN